MPEKAKRVFEGQIFDVYQWEQEVYDGSTMTFERIARPDTVVIFPILESGEVLLVEDSQPGRSTLLTAPAGRLEEGETPEEAALRELKEETGYVPDAIELLYAYQPYNKMDWMIHVFVGKPCRKVAEQNLDAGEKISLKPVTVDQLFAMAVSGEYAMDQFDVRVLRAMQNPDEIERLRARFTI